MFSILSFCLVESFLVRLFILIHDSPARRAARTSAARGVKHIQWGNVSFPHTKGSLTWGTTLYFHSLLISRPVRSQDVFSLARWPRARSSTQRTARLLSNFIFNAPDITTLTSGNNSAQTWHSLIATFVFVLDALRSQNSIVSPFLPTNHASSDLVPSLPLFFPTSCSPSSLLPVRRAFFRHEKYCALDTGRSFKALAFKNLVWKLMESFFRP